MNQFFIFIIGLLFMPFMGFSQKTDNSWSIDACFGGTNPVKPYSPGYWSNTVSFFHTSVGGRYMFNNKFGLKLDAGYDRVTNDIVGQNGNSLPFKSNYYRTSIQGVFDLGRIFTFENFSERVSLLFHVGGGLSVLTNKQQNLSDRMVNFLFGFTPQYKINERIAVNIDASFIWHIYQQYTFDMTSNVYKRGFDGFIANATVGVNYYLGKNEKHYDWAFSPCYPDMRYLEDENSKLKIQNEELAKKLGDDDNDGVINYLDFELDTKPGELVDLKGRSLKNIDTDGDGINNFYDECPNEPGTIKLNGCPEKSKGNDNIADNTPKDGGKKDSIADNLINDSIKPYINKDYNFEAPEGYSSLTDIHFGKWQSEILSQEESVINEISSLLKANPDAKIIIAGHSDNVGDINRNIEISKKRANMVRNYLISKGVKPENIEINFYGAGVPKFLNSTETGKYLNRRAEILIDYGKE
jgi:OmpA-OmpF porin, OOP family